MGDDAKVRIVAGHNDDFDNWFFVEPTSGGEYDDSEGYFDGEVSAELWKRWNDTLDALNKIEAELLDTLEVDGEEHRRRTVCSEWTGSSGYPGQRWWQINLTASGSDDEWPVRDVDNISRHFDSRDDAESVLASLPDEFHLYTLGYGGDRIHIVKTDRLVIEERGYGPSGPTRCYRCGWDQSDHEHVGEEIA